MRVWILSCYSRQQSRIWGLKGAKKDIHNPPLTVVSATSLCDRSCCPRLRFHLKGENCRQCFSCLVDNTIPTANWRKGARVLWYRPGVEKCKVIMSQSICGERGDRKLTSTKTTFSAMHQAHLLQRVQGTNVSLMQKKKRGTRRLLAANTCQVSHTWPPNRVWYDMSNRLGGSMLSQASLRYRIDECLAIPPGHWY